MMLTLGLLIELYARIEDDVEIMLPCLPPFCEASKQPHATVSS